MCGLLPLIVIFFVEMNKRARLLDSGASGGTYSIDVCIVFGLSGREGSPTARLEKGSNTSITISHNVNAKNPSILRPMSNDITSASVLLYDTAVCFLHVHENGYKWMINKHTEHSPGVEFDSAKSPPKSESWNEPSLQHDKTDDNPKYI